MFNFSNFYIFFFFLEKILFNFFQKRNNNLNEIDSLSILINENNASSVDLFS